MEMTQVGSRFDEGETAVKGKDGKGGVLLS